MADAAATTSKTTKPRAPKKPAAPKKAPAARKATAKKTTPPAK